MAKYLDMPEGNGRCEIYNEFANNVENGRTVGIIRVLMPNGTYSWFVASGEPLETLDESNSILHAFAMIQRARTKAESQGYHPSEVNPRELV